MVVINTCRVSTFQHKEKDHCHLLSDYGKSRLSALHSFATLGPAWNKVMNHDFLLSLRYLPPHRFTLYKILREHSEIVTNTVELLCSCDYFYYTYFKFNILTLHFYVTVFTTSIFKQVTVKSYAWLVTSTKLPFGVHGSEIDSGFCSTRSPNTFDEVDHRAPILGCGICFAPWK